MIREDNRVFSIVKCNFSTLVCWLQDTKTWPMDMMLEAGEKTEFAKRVGARHGRFLQPILIPIDDQSVRVVAFLSTREWVGFELSRDQDGTRITPYSYIPWQKVVIYSLVLLFVGGWPILLLPLILIRARLWTERLSRLYLNGFCRYIEKQNLIY